jgi:hypothetical protein
MRVLRVFGCNVPMFQNSDSGKKNINNYISGSAKQLISISTGTP